MAEDRKRQSANDDSGGTPKVDEERYRAAIESCADGFMTVDGGGRILEVNEAYVRRSGYSRPELLSMHVSQLEAKEDPAETAEHIRKLHREGSELFETLHRAKDGTVWQVEVNTSYWPIEGGRFFSFLRDISRRKRSESLLRTRFELSEIAGRGTVDDLLRHALDTVELHTGSSIGFFHFVDEDQETLTLQAWSTNTLRRLCSAAGKGKHYPISKAGVWVDCVHAGKPVIHNDYASLPHRKGLPEGHATVAREVVVPVLRDGMIVAVAGVGNKTSDYVQADAEILQEIASLTMDIVLRKRTEEALRESEDRYRRLVQTANSVILSWDTAGNVRFINDYGERFFGFGKDELIGRNVIGTIVPREESSGRDLAQLMLEIQRDPDRFTDNENENVTKDGRRVWVRWANRAVTDPQGKLVGVLSVGNDVTGRKQAEAALRQSETNYRTLFDSSTDGIFLLDLDGNIVDANRTAYERLGYTREEFLGMSVRQLDDPAFASRVPERLRQIQERSIAVFESGHRRKDGTTMPVEVNSRLLEYQGKTVFFSVVRDITERKRAEEKLRENEAFIRGILDTVDEGFIVVDRDFRILTVNKAYCDQVGATCGDVIGRHCYEVSHRASRPCHEAGEECAVLKVFASGRPQTALHRHPDAQGQLIYVETKAYPMTDAEGRLASVIETVTNITERKLLEEERLKTQKLESIGTLAGGIAHDFNNLLQGVFGYISMAKMPLDRGDRSFAMLDQAEKALHLSVNLTNQLLTFSKGGKPVKKRVALGPVIANAARFALSGSRSVCRLEIDPGLWEADADEGQIAQVIQNVALNADQAMPLGGTVTVTARNLAAAEAASHPGLGPRDCVEITIRDEGVGIPAPYLDKIFDPYFTTKEKGSGLGLATSYSIVKNHGGKIEVHSTPGSGSTFTISLPAIPSATTTTAAPAAPAPVRTGRVLVMDDEEIVRSIAGELLAALGHEVVLAERGETALERYRAAREAGRPFDVVILDLTIRGGMGGAETMRRLLEIDAGVKVVVSSGYSDDDVISSFRAHGFRAFLKKPYRLEELKSTLNALLD